jgi:hypothetical protein
MFLCIGPDCCSYSKGGETWHYLKKRVKELDLGDSVFRTKPLACVFALVASSLLFTLKAPGITA